VSIGQSLAHARAEAGLTLDQVSARTRVRKTIISSIEHDDFSLCGGDFYARGHIRSIAQAVGTDPEPLVAQFDAEFAATAAPLATEVFESETAAKAERRGPNWSLAMAAALVLVVLYGVVQFLGGDGDRRTTDLAGPTQSSAVTSTPSASRPAASKPATPTEAPVAQAPRDAVTVQLATTGKSWVSVQNGAGKQVFQGLLGARQEKTFTDKRRLRLVIGNAGAVQLTVNGKSVGAPGGPGEVARVEFVPGDPATG
jgi:cytoskeletal protein RodZ